MVKMIFSWTEPTLLLKYDIRKFRSNRWLITEHPRSAQEQAWEAQKPPAKAVRKPGIVYFFIRFHGAAEALGLGAENVVKASSQQQRDLRKSRQWKLSEQWKRGESETEQNGAKDVLKVSGMKREAAMADRNGDNDFLQNRADASF